MQGAMKQKNNKRENVYVDRLKNYKESDCKHQLSIKQQLHVKTTTL